MPTLHLLHGIPGAGKTTFARQLERDARAVRFSPDEWMVALYGTNPPEAQFRQQHPRIMEMIWQQAERVLHAGCDVVLDAGFWSRASRDDARRRATDLDIPCRFYVLDCEQRVARQRVLSRTAALPPGTLEITAATFDLLLKQIELLGDDEDHSVVETAHPKLNL